MQGMSVRCYSLALLACLVPGASATASDADVLNQFGMLGHLAVVCAAPPSAENPHLVLSVSPQGKITRTLNAGNHYVDTSTMHSLRFLTSELLQWEQSGGWTLTFKKIDGRFRPWRTVRTDGAVHVADGWFTEAVPPPRAHQPTVSFVPCVIS
jgi:hypothetical protein